MRETVKDMHSKILKRREREREMMMMMMMMISKIEKKNER